MAVSFAPMPVTAQDFVGQRARTHDRNTTANTLTWREPFISNNATRNTSILDDWIIPGNSGTGLAFPAHAPGALPKASNSSLAVVFDSIKGLWVRYSNQWFGLTHEIVNPKFFGATGNGISSDNSAWQRAVNALPAGGGKIECSPGDYLFTAAVILVSKIELQGELGCRIVTPDGTINLFSGSGVNHVHIHGFWADGPAPAGGGEETGNFFYCVNCTDINVHDVFVQETAQAVTVKTSSRVTISNLQTLGTSAYTIYVLGSTDVSIMNLIVHSTTNCNTAIQTQSSAGARSNKIQIVAPNITCKNNGIQIRDTDNIEVVGGHIAVTSPRAYHNVIGANNSSNITIKGVVGNGSGASTSVFYFADSSNTLSVMGNIARNAGRDGFQIGSAGTLDAVVIGNLVIGGGPGDKDVNRAAFRFDTDSSNARNNRFTIIGNIARDFNGHCFTILGNRSNYMRVAHNVCDNPTLKGFNVDNAAYSDFDGNLVTGAGAVKANYFHCDYCIIRGNQFLDADGPKADGAIFLGTGSLIENNVATQRSGSGQDYGFRIQSGALTFLDNYLEGNQIAPMSLAGGTITYRKRGRQIPKFSPTPIFDVSRGDVIDFGTLTGNVTSVTINNAYPGHVWTLIVTQDRDGGYAVSGWPGNVKFAGGAWTPTRTGGTKSSVTFLYDGTNHIEIARTLDVR